MRALLIIMCITNFSLPTKAITSIEPFRIQICTTPLSLTIDVPHAIKFLISSFKLQHLFIRGTDKNTVNALNFEPRDKTQWFNSQAIIGKQDYKNAHCVELFESTDSKAFKREFARFVAEFEYAATVYPYNILSNNCQIITLKVIKKLNYQLPVAIAQALSNQVLSIEK